MNTRVFLVFCFCLLSNGIWAQEAINITNGDYQLIGKHIRYFVDSTGEMTVEQAVNQNFTPFENDDINLGLTPFAVWMRFDITSTDFPALLLEIGEPNLEVLEIYNFQAENIETIYKGGFKKPFDQRPIKNNKWLFELNFEETQTLSIGIKAQSGYPMAIPISISAKNQFIEDLGRRNLFWGIYIGILLFAFFYNLFLYLSLRESMYLYYSLYVLCALGFYAGIQGFNFRYLWPQLPALNSYLPVIISLMNLFVFLFTLRFLNITKTKKIAYFGGWFFVSLYLLAAVINLSGRYGIAIIMTQMLSVLMSFYYIYIVIDAIRKKVPNAKYFGLAWIQFIILLVIFILADNNVVPLNNFTKHSLFIGNALEVLLLSFALAARINFLKEDNTRKQEEIIHQLEENDRIQRLANEELEQKVVERTAQLVEQKNEAVKQRTRSDELLLNILPEETAKELKATGSAVAKLYDPVTVLFADMANFTEKCQSLGPQELVAEVNEIFTAFDQIVDQYGIEKIKTIGDSYMAACGLPKPQEEHALIMTRAAFEMQAYIENRTKQKRKEGKIPFEIRIGLHSGPVIAGVVGFKKFAFDIWGPTVNVASRMEGKGMINKINVSHSTFELIKDHFDCSPRGQIEAKGIGAVNMYFVDRPKG